MMSLKCSTYTYTQASLRFCKFFAVTLCKTFNISHFKTVWYSTERGLLLGLTLKAEEMLLQSFAHFRIVFRQETAGP